jgi:hypothetical protein
MEGAAPGMIADTAGRSRIAFMTGILYLVLTSSRSFEYQSDPPTTFVLRDSAWYHHASAHLIAG